MANRDGRGIGPHGAQRLRWRFGREPPHSLGEPNPSSLNWLAVLHKQVQSNLTSGKEVFQGGEKGTSGGLPETWIQTPDDKEYVFEAACSGSAAMEFYPKTKKPHKEPERILACNGKALTYPFKGGDLITVKLLGSNTPGLLIWQVVRQPH